MQDMRVAQRREISEQRSNGVNNEFDGSERRCISGGVEWNSEAGWAWRSNDFSMKKKMMVITLSVACEISAAWAADVVRDNELCIPPKCDPSKSVNPPRAAEPVRPGAADNMPRAVAPGTRDEMPKPKVPGTADDPIIVPDKNIIDRAK